MRLQTGLQRERLKEAKLKLGNACIEEIDYSARRELDKAQVRQLSSCQWVAEHQNIAITGSTGTGKTYLACALAQQACRKGYRAIYRRATRLSDELTLAHADGTYGQLLGRFARADVLVIDDWGLAPVKDQERRDLLEVMEDRDGTRSTIMTSQLPTTKWHDHLGDPTMADAKRDHRARAAAKPAHARRPRYAQSLEQPRISILPGQLTQAVIVGASRGGHGTTHR